MPKKSRNLPQKKKVPLSRCIPPETGSGRINAPHGGRYYIALSTGHKKGQSGKGWRTSRRLFQMECTANIGIVFGSATKKAEVFCFRPRSSSQAASPFIPWSRRLGLRRRVLRPMQLFRPAASTRCLWAPGRG